MRVVVAASISTKAKCKTKAKAKAKGKASGANGGSPSSAGASKSLAQAERDVKDIMSKEITQLHLIGDISMSIQEKPDEWLWAVNFMREISVLEEKRDEVKNGHGSFYKTMQAAALSPSAIKDLKKKLGEDYHTNLIRVLDAMKPIVLNIADLLSKVQEMSKVNVAVNSGKTVTTPSAKRRKS